LSQLRALRVGNPGEFAAKGHLKAAEYWLGVATATGIGIKINEQALLENLLVVCFGYFRAPADLRL
jgi:hypothetical protein